MLDTMLRMVYGPTMTWQIRNVPDRVHKVLKHEAVDRGSSLNTLVIEILTAVAEKIEKDVWRWEAFTQDRSAKKRGKR